MDVNEARPVIASLRLVRDQIDQLVDEPADPALQLARFDKLKAAIEAASKYGTCDGRKRPLTECEDLYFAPAVKQAGNRPTASHREPTPPTVGRCASRRAHRHLRSTGSVRKGLPRSLTAASRT